VTEGATEVVRRTAARPSRFRIVCIAQVFNEMRRGNLERFIEHIAPLVDAVVVYDDGSTDGSYEYLLAHTPYVFRSPRNDFADEGRHKRLLLEEARRLKPDFILWLDADEVLASEDPEDLQRACAWGETRSLDGVELHEVNLWRSHSWRRLDSSYDLGWFVRLWRVTPEIRWETLTKGLHQPPYPSSIRTVDRYADLKVLHYGFANECNLAHKYLGYRARGQRGYEMLDRLVSEEQLVLEKVPASEFPVDLRRDDPEPTPLSLAQSLSYVERHRAEVFRPGISIVCLIYKSVELARFVREQVLRYTDMRDKEFFFVANDATEEVLGYLRASFIPHFEWNNTEEQRQGWYINNVYRAYNFGAEQARGDFVVFINSDMAFSPGWLDGLWEAYDGSSDMASRLVESGKLTPGQHAIERDFGRTPTDYREQDFVDFAEAIREPSVADGGLYMPLLVRREAFLSIGGYPEGNLRPGSDIFHPEIARLGEACVSGDNVMVQRLRSRGVHHRTASDSVVYHFQMGEIDAVDLEAAQDRPLVAVCNDLVTGTMGERVLWDFLLEGLPSTVGVDIRVVGTDGPYASLAREYIAKNRAEVAVLIQNATFIDTVDPALYTVAFLQDNLRAMGRDSSQQEKTLSAARIAVTNSLLTALSYPEYDFEIIPVGVDSQLFRPMDKSDCRAMNGLGPERIGIFVGAFDEVKGWPAVRQCIETFPEITWLLVTKKAESFEAANARTYSRVPQDTLVTLLNSADFFILGSPVETQCLAAIEACLCDVPVVMRNTGVFSELTDDERQQAGVFGNDLVRGVRSVAEGSFRPRHIALSKDWTVSDSIAKWRSLLERAMQEVTADRVGFVGQKAIDETGEATRRERTLRPPTHALVPTYSYAPAPALLLPPRSRSRFLSPRYLAGLVREHGVVWCVRTAANHILRRV
jgi:glycosyltransferase involved in cell wall biosynthesis